MIWRLLLYVCHCISLIIPCCFFSWHSFSPPYVSAKECKCPCWWNISPACNLGIWCGHPVMDCMPNRQWKEQGTGNKILMTLSGPWRGLMLAKTWYHGLGRPLGFFLILQAVCTLLLTVLTQHLVFMGSLYIGFWKSLSTFIHPAPSCNLESLLCKPSRVHTHVSAIHTYL